MIDVVSNFRNIFAKQWAYPGSGLVIFGTFFFNNNGTLKCICIAIGIVLCVIAFLRRGNEYNPDLVGFERYLPMNYAEKYISSISRYGQGGLLFQKLLVFIHKTIALFLLWSAALLSIPICLELYTLDLGRQTALLNGAIMSAAGIFGLTFFSFLYAIIARVIEITEERVIPKI